MRVFTEAKFEENTECAEINVEGHNKNRCPQLE
jgi:hypothetical protein